MSLLDKFSAFADDKKDLLSLQPQFFGTPMEELYSATEAKIGGKRIHLLGTNNYLGLTFDPSCIKAAHDAIDSEGTGTTGSRMANGNYSSHQCLEQELSDFYQTKTTIVFSTGFQANLGAIGGLAGAGEVLLIDADSHASIYDGCQLSGADVIRFRHNDPEDLRKRLRRLGDRASSTLIVVEGIYSMLGDQSPLLDIVKVKEEFGSYLLIDEAHSLGVLGKTGQGLVEAMGVLDRVDFITGTFSKSLGAIGGFCTSNHPQLDTLRYLSRSYIFTASPSPSSIASVRAALPLLRDGIELRKTLWQHCNKLYKRLADCGYVLGPQPGPIIAIELESTHQAIAFWNALLESGVYVNLVLPPATPTEKPLVRCSISAAHTTAQISYIGDTFEKLKESL